MSVNSRYRERKYNSSENDRLLRILSQPVQSWEKKWAPSSRSKSHHIHKWVKSDRTIVFEDEDDDEEDEEDKDQVMTEADKDTPLTTGHDNIPVTTQQHDGNLATTTENRTQSDSVNMVRDSSDGTGLFSTRSPPTNKQVTSTAIDEERTHTPKLSDVPDVDPDQIMADNDDDKESNTDDLNDPSRHPAYAPHIHPRLNDDDVLGTTPSQSEQTSTEATPKENDDFPMATTDHGSLTDTTNNSIVDNTVTTGANEPNITIETTLPTAAITELNSTITPPSPPNPVPTTDVPEETSNIDHSTVHASQVTSSPIIATSDTITTTGENEPPLVSSSPPPQQQQQQQQDQPLPVEQHKGTMDIDDRLLDAPVKTPDVVSSTNTPGVDTPFDTDTPSDMPMQRNINVVTENETEMDITPTDPQANDEPAQ